MTTFSVKLTELRVSAWFPPEEPIEEELIEDAHGIYTVSTFGSSVGYYLQVDSGKRANPLRLGQAVTASGKDEEGKNIRTVILETTGTGEIPQFKGPYHQALETVSKPLQQKTLDALQTDDGAQFWGYISPQHDTSKFATDWRITLTQGNWTGQISSEAPQKILDTPGLSGIFDVCVEASGPSFAMKKLKPKEGSHYEIGANSNCSSMVGIVANEDGTDAKFWTTWDAICKTRQ